MARHLPKVTPSFFAEFLEHLSPDRLSLLDQPTCVGNEVRQNMILPTNLFLQTEKEIIVLLSCPFGLSITTRLNAQTDLPILHCLVTWTPREGQSFSTFVNPWVIMYHTL